MSSEIGDIAKSIAELCKINTADSANCINELLKIMQQLVNIKANVSQAKIEEKQNKQDKDKDEVDIVDEDIYFSLIMNNKPSNISFVPELRQFKGSKEDFLDYLRILVNEFYKANGRE